MAAHSFLTSRVVLLLTACTIFALGLIVIFSTTSAEVLDHELDKSTYQALLKQILYAVGGVMLGAIVYKTGYRSIIANSPMILGFLTVLLVLTLIPGIGREVNGSKRWLNILGFSVQPSEFVKYLVPAYFIYRFIKHKRQLNDFKSFIKIIGIVAIPMVLILVEPNNGTTAVIGMTLVVLLFISCVPFKFWAWPLLGFVLVGGVFASQLPYVTARLKVYMHPELDLKGKGHQPYQAKIAAGSGQLWGKGPGNGVQKLSYLPEAQNDYIAAIYAEEFGFVGIACLIVLYMIVASMGFSIASQAVDWEGFYMGTCITFLITFQAFLNLGVVSGLLPSTGLNLPLFSQGGSSLMANMMGLSLLLSIAERRSVSCLQR